eukprot:2900461-Rhodomonas_salina.1
MFFFDVIGEASQEEPDLDRLACVYRQGAAHSSGRLSTSDVVRYASDIHLGDIVTVLYFRRPLDTSRGERSVEVHDFRVDKSWKDANPEKEFAGTSVVGPCAWNAKICTDSGDHAASGGGGASSA